MTSIRLVLIAVSAALSLSSMPGYAQTPAADGLKPSTRAALATGAGATRARIDAGTSKLLSDRQMDKATAGLAIDLAGYSTAFNAWLAGIQSVLATYTGPGTEGQLTTIFTGCDASHKCASGTPPPSLLPFVKP
jgi:hypothetical protein